MTVNVYDELIQADVIHVFAFPNKDGTLDAAIALECEGKSMTAIFLDEQGLLGHIRSARKLLADMRAQRGK